MAPYTMVMIGMILMAWDVTKCVARPADIDNRSEETDYGRRSDDYELNAIESEPSGLYKGKATGKSDWKEVFRLAEIVRLSKKLEQVLRNEAEEIKAESAPTEGVSSPAETRSSSSAPIYGPERIIDQLHENTGEKQPVHHSALDGWIF